MSLPCTMASCLLSRLSKLSKKCCSASAACFAFACCNDLHRTVASSWCIVYLEAAKILYFAIASACTPPGRHRCYSMF